MTIHTMSIGELERVAELVRRDHSSLNTMRLIPDGKYQTRTVTLAEVTREVAERLRDGFRDRARNDFPTLFCAWGKCRVGSTALNNLFGAAGLPSYYQPVKTILRHRLLEAAGEPWRLPYATEHPHVFSKETAGPYVPAECLFNPLQALLEAGYPADKLRLIVLDREPESSLASWLAKWSERLPECKLIRNYIVAALNKHRVEAYARRHGIAVTHYVYEAAKDSVQSVQILFARL
ncbi:MAG: sulfotransferase family protein, partial [Xanthobacteraceae bacterium]